MWKINKERKRIGKVKVDDKRERYNENINKNKDMKERKVKRG